MEEKTIAQLKKQGAIGQVITKAWRPKHPQARVLVIVKETELGVEAMGLQNPYPFVSAGGIVVGDPNKTYPFYNETRVFVLNREEWKQRYPARWRRIAAWHPEVNEL